MSRRRHIAITFRFRPAPVFSRCEGCGAVLAGKRAWQWYEGDSLRCACALCVFPRDPRVVVAATVGAPS